jgi:thiol:disulfide interchange protein DsbC
MKSTLSIRREIARSAACATLTLIAVAAAAMQITAEERKALEEKFPGVTVGEIRSTPVPGWNEIWLNGEPMYVSSDQRYLFNGRLLEIETKMDLTRAARARVRAIAIDALDERDMIIYAPAETKYQVTMFTDVSCAHCRQIQRDMEALNRLGVRVRLLALPRHGPGTEAWHAMEAAWCASDRKAALARLMDEGIADESKAPRGENKAAPCTPSIVAEQYALAQRLHLAGTPTIIAPNGEIIGGYLAPDALVRKLDALPNET